MLDKSPPSIFQELFQSSSPSFQSRTRTRNSPKAPVSAKQPPSLSSRDATAQPIKSDKAEPSSIFGQLFTGAGPLRGPSRTPTDGTSSEESSDIQKEQLTPATEPLPDASSSAISSELKAFQAEIPDKDIDEDILVRQDTNRFVHIWPLSKSLQESDFYRIGTKGENIDGWNGLVKSGSPPFSSTPFLPSSLPYVSKFPY